MPAPVEAAVRPHANLPYPRSLHALWEQPEGVRIARHGAAAPLPTNTHASVMGVGSQHRRVLEANIVGCWLLTSWGVGFQHRRVLAPSIQLGATRPKGQDEPLGMLETNIQGCWKPTSKRGDQHPTMLLWGCGEGRMYVRREGGILARTPKKIRSFRIPISHIAHPRRFGKDRACRSTPQFRRPPLNTNMR